MADHPAEDTTLCSGTCNPILGSVVTTKIKPEPLVFFYPFTGELLECPIESAAAVRQESELLAGLVDRLIKAQLASATATQAVYESQKQVDAGVRASAIHVLAENLKREDQAREEMFAEFKDLPKFNDGANGLMEILPLMTHDGKKVWHTSRMTYVRSEKVKNHFRTRTQLPGDAAKLKAFYTKNSETGQYGLDSKKFSEAIHTVKLKSSVAKYEQTLWARGWAPEFVEGFNAKHDPAKRKEAADRATAQDAMVQFSGGATLLRFFAGVGSEKKVDLSSKSVKELLQGRGEVAATWAYKGRAGIELAAAKINPVCYLPAKHGLHLHIAAGKNAKGGAQELDLGYVRLLIDCEAGVSCGASVLAEAGVEFKLKADMTSGVKGSAVERDAAALSNPKARVDKKVEGEAAGKVDLSAFAGAEANAKLSGALQWQKAESTEFNDFAKISAEGRAQAGIGGAAMFNIGYDEGKFKIRAKLGACVGLGLKGELGAEVGIVEIIEFDLWFKHQVVNALDQNLRYFKDDAFKAFIYMKALAISEKKKLGDYLSQTGERLALRWKYLAENATAGTLLAIESANDYLLSGLAEAKGLLLNLLEQMHRNYEDLRGRFERAMRRIMASSQTIYERDNIYQRIALEVGPKGDVMAGRQRVANIVGEVQLTLLEEQMKTEPTPGYRLAMGESFDYRFSRGMGTHIA